MISFHGTTAFGIDISDFAIRLVAIQKNRSKIFITSFNEMKVPEGIIVNGEIKDQKKLVDSINKLLKTVSGSSLKQKEVISVLPETKTFIKVIDVEKTDDDKLAQAVQEELKNHIPLDIDEVYFDWQIIAEVKSGLKVLAGIAPKNSVDSYLTVLRQAQLIPLALEIEAAAISRALINPNDQKAKVIIDIGAARTGLIVFDHGTVQFTVSLPISGDRITQEISSSLKLDYKKSEKAKFVCGLDEAKCKGALKKILFGTMENLASEINKSLNFYKSHFSQAEEISEVILCGGGAYFQKIDQFLSQRLNLQVSLGNPLQAIQNKNLNEIKFPVKKALSYTTAIGLALRGVQKDIL